MRQSTRTNISEVLFFFAHRSRKSSITLYLKCILENKFVDNVTDRQTQPQLKLVKMRCGGQKAVV